MGNIKDKLSSKASDYKSRNGELPVGFSLVQAEKMDEEIKKFERAYSIFLESALLLNISESDARDIIKGEIDRIIY